MFVLGKYAKQITYGYSMNVWKVIVSTGVAISLITGIFALDIRWKDNEVKASDFQKLEYRLDIKILRDDISYLNSQLRNMRMQHGDFSLMPADVKEVYIEIDTEKQELKEELRILREKVR